MERPANSARQPSNAVAWAKLMARRRREPRTEFVDAEIIEPTDPRQPQVIQRIIVADGPPEPEPLRKTGAPDTLRVEALGDQLLGEFVNALRRAIRRI